MADHDTDACRGVASPVNTTRNNMQGQPGPEITSFMGHVKNNEAKVWQNGHETWKMNTHFDAPASFFLMASPVQETPE